MRDPRRIDPLLQALGEYWHRHPDLRLGQIVVNLTGRSDPFYVEDGQIADELTRAALAPAPESKRRPEEAS